MATEPIKVLDTDMLIKLHRGKDTPPTKLYVRRTKPTTQLRVAETVGLREGDEAAKMKMGFLLMRMAIVGAEDLTDCQTLEPVKFETARNGGLGVMATEKVIDALGSMDIKLVQLAMEGVVVSEREAEEEDEGAEGDKKPAVGLSEGQTGNS